MYLLTPLILKNLKKSLEWIKSYKDKSFSGTNWPKELLYNILVDNDGSVDILKAKCLKPKCGSGNIIGQHSKAFARKCW